MNLKEYRNLLDGRSGLGGGLNPRPQLIKYLILKSYMITSKLMTSLEQNKALMRSYIEEAWNKGDLDFIDKNFSSDFVNHGTFPGQPTDRDGVKWVINNIRNAVPDVDFTVEDMIAEGDKVVTRWLAEGTHKDKGDLMGAKPTGKKISISATVIDRIKDSKVVEHWANRDDLAFLQQIGLIPRLG
jgi:steroid delta-isomerase-like uncharacterized protein